VFARFFLPKTGNGKIHLCFPRFLKVLGLNNAKAFFRIIFLSRIKPLIQGVSGFGMFIIKQWFVEKFHKTSFYDEE